MDAKPRECSYLGLSRSGFHRIAYVEWGEPSNRRTLVCVHGLTRNGRDFDTLAAAMADAYRVACPDVVGRGRSEWLADKTGYDMPQYCADLNALLARLDGDSVDWLGTSMGGLIGMALAALPGAPIRRLILNDIGPFIPKSALERIALFVGKDPQFPDLAAAESYMREVSAPFGRLSDRQWHHLTIHAVKQVADGGWRLRYDPAIGDAFRQSEIKDVDLWALWDRISCPVLVLRGRNSDLLLPETTAEMARRGPKSRCVEFPDCGHAPALMAPEQIAVVREFLLSPP
ncbi:MAG TPA: alpha/beta hydrolase [Alphaproteobacteria bacterium]|nr:alpha/beta hydrolase [Alphaproteobacteria bacterium]